MRNAAHEASGHVARGARIAHGSVSAALSKMTKSFGREAIAWRSEWSDSSNCERCELAMSNLIASRTCL